MANTTPLFGRKHREQLFAQKEAEVDNSVAWNRAYTETQVLGDPTSLEYRTQVQRTGNVEDETIKRLHETLLDSDPTDLLARLGEQDLTREEKTSILAQEISRRDFRSLSSRDVLLYASYLGGAQDVPLDFFESKLRATGPSDIQALRDQTSREQRYRARREVDDFVATQGFESYGDMFANVAGQDFLPVYNVASRVGLNRRILETATGKPVEGFSGFFTGEIRQQIREHLQSLPPEEFYQTVKRIVKDVQKLERDPKWGPLLTKYNILETFEGLFTDELLDGTSPDNTWDRWFGNLDVALESLFTAGTMLAWGFKGIRSAARATDNIRAAQVARTVARRDIQAEWVEALKNDALASKFQIEEAGGIPQNLPKPPQMIDDLDILTEETKQVVKYTENVSEDILRTTDKVTGLGLTVSERANVVRKELEALDLGDNIAVMPKMSVLEPLENDTGFRMHVVMGEAPDRGFSTIEDAVEAIKDLDLDEFKIMQANENGVLGEVLMDGKLVDPGSTSEFYIVRQQERYWHTIDKEAFGELGGLQNTGLVPRAILPPHMRIDEDVYQAFFQATGIEQNTIAKFNVLLKPYFDLSTADKRFVASVMEWGEDFAKAHGRAPMLTEYFARYDGITTAQIEGIIAQRKALDTMYEISNRRLYRDWKSQGYKTARSRNAPLANYHGRIMDKAEISTRQGYLDPVTGDLVKLSKAEIEDLYAGGGQVMKLDMAIDVPMSGKGKADQVILRTEDYEVGALSTRPLNYHAGYSPRFYDDPWYIVKESTGEAVNGVVRSGDAATSRTAVKTAGTQREAERFARRANLRETDGGKKTSRHTFKVVPGKELDSVESQLLQKETLHREGRLFWDQRNYDRLPNVNGNLAELEDPVSSIERTVSLISRQTAQEDLLKKYKSAFAQEYADLDGVTKANLQHKTLRQVQEDLEVLKRKNTGNTRLNKRYGKAIEFVKYLRLLEGTESSLIPRMRELALGVANTVNAWSKGRIGGKSTQKYLQAMDPARSIRSANFRLFMALRPARQALLQSMQISYLTALKPGYVASGAIFRDSYALRMGLMQLRNAGYDYGISLAKRAKAMGLKEAEYKELLKQFDRSGLVDLVDVHSFAGGARRSKRIPLPKKGEPSSYVGYMGRQVGTPVLDWAQRIGFDWGERNNLTFTFALALRKHVDDNKVKSLLDLTQKDWDKIALDSSNLALGMIRPNNFGYQSGLMSIPTQFMAFSHKAMLGILGLNPATRGTTALKIAAGTYFLFGANMYGGRDFVDQQLTNIGVQNDELIDLISAGVIELVMNKIAKAIDEESKDLDLGPLAPGMDFTRFWDMQLGMLAEQPWKVAFGPFSNVSSRVLQSFEFVNKVMKGTDRSPEEKFLKASSMLASGLFPQYNDLVQARLAMKMGHWVSASGETIPVMAAWNSVIAKGLLGVNQVDQIAYYELQNQKWESDQFYNDVVQSNKKFIRQLIRRWDDGEFSDREVFEIVGTLTDLMEDFPEARRQEALSAILKEVGPDETDSVILQLRKMMEKRQLGPESIALIDRFEDIPEDKREQVKAMAQEVWEGQLEHDEISEQTIRERLKDRE